jgi:hypothetical protein
MLLTKQILAWVFVVVFLSLQQGCASFSFKHLFGEKKPPELGQVGMISSGTTPEVSTSGISMPDDASHSETLKVAVGTGAASAVIGAAWYCIPEILFPPVYAGCVAALGIAGTLAGAVIGYNATTVKDAGAATAMLPLSIDPQAALRTEVIALTKTSTDKPGIDLGTLALESKPENNTVSANDFVQNKQPEDFVDYRKYAPQGINTVLETNLLNVEFNQAGTDKYQLILHARSRLIDTGDGKEIMSKTHKYKGPEFSDTGVTQGAGINIQALNDGISSLAHEVVNVYFPQAKQPE